MSNTLRDRAAGTEVATTNGKAPTLDKQIQAMEAQFQLAMPRGAEAKQLVRDALTALRTTPKLAEADPRTVLGALMTCSQLGLRPGVLGHAWVLPFYDKKSRGQKAQLVIGYQGLVELAHRSGKIQSLIARTVFENDEFDVAYGLEDRLHHKPNLNEDRGKPIAYYAVVKLTTGGHAFTVMTQTDVEAHRDKHAMAKTREGVIVGPWRDNFEAMAHKTCVLKLAKWMPKGTDLAVAIAADESVRVDVTPDHGAESVSHHYTGDDVVEGEVVEEADEATLQDLRDQVYAAGALKGFDEFSLNDKFSEITKGLVLVDAGKADLDGFLGWIEKQPEADA